VGVAMPIAVIIEESPVDSPLAEGTFDLSHLPAHFLQYYPDNVDPIYLITQELFNFAVLPIKFIPYLLNYFCEIINGLDCFTLILFQFWQGCVVIKLFTLVVFLQKGLPILKRKFVVD
jgi:hypothetical protein